MRRIGLFNGELRDEDDFILSFYLQKAEFTLGVLPLRGAFESSSPSQGKISLQIKRGCEIHLLETHQEIVLSRFSLLKELVTSPLVLEHAYRSHRYFQIERTVPFGTGLLASGSKNLFESGSIEKQDYRPLVVRGCETFSILAPLHHEIEGYIELRGTQRMPVA